MFVTDALVVHKIPNARRRADNMVTNVICGAKILFNGCDVPEIKKK